MTQSAVTLRPARPSDARAMAEMSRDYIEKGLGWRYTPGRMSHIIRDREAISLVACDAAGLQGFAVMQFGDERAHLVLMCVRPAQQRGGIGRRMIEWLVESALVAGIESLHLELRADNLGARAFYKSLGFSETLLMPGYYEGRVAARRMLRMLRTPRRQG